MTSYFFWKIGLTIIVIISQVLIALLSIGKLQNSFDQLNLKGKSVILMSALSGLLAVFVIIIDKWESNDDDAAMKNELKTQALHYEQHLDSINKLNFSKLDSSDKNTIKLLAEYNLQRNDESTKIITLIDSRPEQEPWVTPFFDNETMEIKDKVLTLYWGVQNDGTSMASDVKAKYSCFFKENGKFYTISSLRKLHVPTNVPATGYSLSKWTCNLSEIPPDKIYFFTVITYSSLGTKKFEHEFVNMVELQTKMEFSILYKNDTSIYSFLKNNYGVR